MHYDCMAYMQSSMYVHNTVPAIGSFGWKVKGERAHRDTYGDYPRVS